MTFVSLKRKGLEGVQCDQDFIYKCHNLRERKVVRIFYMSDV